MQNQHVPLSHVFGSVARSMQENQSYLNSLDTRDGDAGDNSVYNWQLVESAIQHAEGHHQDAGSALAAAAQLLRQQGRGQTAPMYANGLASAASAFAGQQAVSATDLLPLLRGLVGGMSTGTHPSSGQATPLDALLPALMGYMAAKQRGANDQEALMAALAEAARSTGMLGSGAAPSQPAPTQPQPGGGLSDLLRGLTGGQPQTQTPHYGSPPQSTPSSPAPSGGNIGDLIGGLLGGQLPQNPPQYAPPQQADPGAAAGAALLGGLLHGFMGGSQAPGVGPAGPSGLPDSTGRSGPQRQI